VKETGWDDVNWIHWTQGRDSLYREVWGSGEAYTGSWWGNLRMRPLGRPRHRWEDNIKMD